MKRLVSVDILINKFLHISTSHTRMQVRMYAHTVLKKEYILLILFIEIIKIIIEI